MIYRADSWRAKGSLCLLGYYTQIIDRDILKQARRNMTALRSAKMPVGSTAWIRDENAQVAQFCAQEIEDFTFSARNELEWLNEHMADIFSKNQVNVTEIFKTPGKLRGKTPRTAKKRNPLESREVSATYTKGLYALTHIASHGHILSERSTDQDPYTSYEFSQTKPCKVCRGLPSG